MIGGRAYRLIRGSSGATSSTWRMKKILASFMTIGALSFVTATGTFALLSSQASNAKGTVATGTLTFNNIVNGGTTCFSWSGATSTNNVNTGCEALFASTTLNYPGTPVTANVRITNDGSLDASDLSVYMPSCTAVATPTAPTPGGGNPCAAGGAQFSIQETDATFTSAVKCWFPAAAGTCAFLANSLRTFSVNGSSAASALDLGSGPARNTSRYFKIGMQLPSGASNTLQGEEALFALTWHMTA